jgi:hypothetical protein
MNIKATRDSADYSLTRAGTFKVGSTSGTIPFKIRRLTGGENCEARFLTEDDRLHVNELFRPLSKREIRLLSKGSEARISSIVGVLEDKLGGVKQDENMVHLSIPSRTKYTENLATSILNLLYIKNNKLILVPLNSSIRTLSSRGFLLKAFREFGEAYPRREIVGYLPAHSSDAVSVEVLLERMIAEYVELGVKIFALDALGLGIPAGMLGRINAYLEGEMDGDFLVIVINQPPTPRGASSETSTGQTVRANDVVELPRGYDGYAPNRIGFPSGDNASEITPARFKKVRNRDLKGKNRLFVPESWGRGQISAIIEEEPDLISSKSDSQYCTKASRKFGIVELFDDDEVFPDTFKDVLRCHDAELVERELDRLGQCALEGIVHDRIEAKTYARPMMQRIEAERSAFDAALKKKGKQKSLF